MTVTATSYTPITYNGNGSTSVFNITFQFYEIAVIHIDSSGSETEWVENTHYILTGGEGAAGSITVISELPELGEQVRIERRTSKDQPRDYDLDNEVLETALQQSDDRLAMILQEVDYDNRRRPAISTSNFTAEVEFPMASTGSVLSWGSDGNLANTALVDLDGVAISALSQTSSLEDVDLLPLYDNSAGDNASISWANVKSEVTTSLDLGGLAIRDTVGSPQIDDNSVTSEKIPDGAIPAEKLAEGIIGNSHWINDAETIPTGDWNDVVSNGFWKAHNAANAPSAGIWWGGIVFAHNSNYVTQIVFDYTNTTSKRLYMRYRNNGTWGNWEKVSVDRKTVPAHYMKFEGTNGSIHYESGFASLTRTGTGRYTCTFAAPEPDANYEVWCDLEAGPHTLPFRLDARARNYSTNGFDIIVGETNEYATAYKDELVYVHVYRRT